MVSAPCTTRRSTPTSSVAAGSFSGAVDTDLDFPVGGEGLNLLSSFFTQGLPEQCIWGDTLTQGVRWHADDPTYQAQNLQGLSLFVASGNGQAGPYDTPRCVLHHGGRAH